MKKLQTLPSEFYKDKISTCYKLQYYNMMHHRYTS